MLTRKTWLWFITAATLSFILWFRLSYPQLAFVNLSVDRNAALDIATHYLKDERGVDIRPFHSAVAFVASSGADVYLQKALGFEKELTFFKAHDYEIFFWKIRFFQEEKKEEYGVLLSAATGEVTDCFHVIDDNTPRPDEGKERSHQRAVEFLQKKFSFNLSRDFAPHGDSSKKFDNRTDYAWLWERKDVFVQWSKNKEEGGAKLISTALISGPEVLSFYKYKLEIPEQFRRDLERRRSVGANFSVLFRVIFLALFIITVFFVVLRRNNLVLHHIKRVAISLAMTFVGLEILAEFNNYDGILLGYSTTISFASYLWQHLSNFLVDAGLASLTILLPCLAAESLHHEVFPEKKTGRFLPFLRTTLFSRDVGRMIFLGYLVAIIMFGIQSVAFSLGQKYLGVWTEHIFLASLSGNTFPWLAAFSLGFTASLNEEIFFRMFGISLGKKYLKNTFLAILVASLIWGYGHSDYPVFPMWFRGLEVTALGIFLSLVYLRFGIITVLVAHYLFDVFWYGASYLLGKATPYYFYSTLIVLLLPLALGLLAYLRNQKVTERPLRWDLNRHQLFNVEVLKSFLRPQNQSEATSSLKLQEEIISHGWDPAVVETALEDLHNEQRP